MLCVCVDFSKVTANRRHSDAGKLRTGQWSIVIHLEHLVNNCGKIRSLPLSLPADAIAMWADDDFDGSKPKSNYIVMRSIQALLLDFNKFFNNAIQFVSTNCQLNNYVERAKQGNVFST